MKTFKNDGKLTANAVKAVKKSVIDYRTGKIYPCTWIAGGGCWHFVDRSAYIKSILEANNFYYTTGNDAKRGGHLGDYIQTTKKGINFLLEIQKINY